MPGLRFSLAVLPSSILASDATCLAVPAADALP